MEEILKGEENIKTFKKKKKKKKNNKGWESSGVLMKNEKREIKLCFKKGRMGKKGAKNIKDIQKDFFSSVF